MIRTHRAHVERVRSVDTVDVTIDLGFGVKVAKTVRMSGVVANVPDSDYRAAMHCMVVALGGRDVDVADPVERAGIVTARVLVTAPAATIPQVDALGGRFVDVADVAAWASTTGFNASAVRAMLEGAEMSNPHNWEDTIRIHDRAIYDWLETLRVDYGTVAGEPRDNHPVLRVFAAPHRAIAQAGDLLVRMGWVAGDTDEYRRIIADADWSVLPLPFVTIDRDEPIFSPELAAPANEFRNLYIDPVTGEHVILPYPLHMLTTYRLTFWCLKRYTHAYWLEWLYSQFGARGAGPKELYLTVHHNPPWGDQMQAVRWIGTADQSDLEGENPRYIRSQVTLIFRTWLHRGTPATVRREPTIHTNRREVFDADDMRRTEAWYGSGNLFRIPFADEKVASVWPTAGAATVSASNRTLTAEVTASGDAVPLVNEAVAADFDGSALVSVAGKFESTASFSITVDNVSVTSVGVASVRRQSITVPQGIASFHEFVLIDPDRMSVQIAGIGSPARVTVTRFTVRRVFSGVPVLPSATEFDGSARRYVFSGLTPQKPYLFVVRLTGTPVAETILFQAGTVAPEYARPRVVTPGALGAVVLLQPGSDGTALVSVPDTLAAGAVTAVPFDGPFLGGTFLP